MARVDENGNVIPDTSDNTNIIGDIAGYGVKAVGAIPKVIGAGLNVFKPLLGAEKSNTDAAKPTVVGNAVGTGKYDEKKLVDAALARKAARENTIAPITPGPDTDPDFQKKWDAYQAAKNNGSAKKTGPAKEKKAALDVPAPDGHGTYTPLEGTKLNILQERLKAPAAPAAPAISPYQFDDRIFQNGPPKAPESTVDRIINAAVDRAMPRNYGETTLPNGTNASNDYGPEYVREVVPGGFGRVIYRNRATGETVDPGDEGRHSDSRMKIIRSAQNAAGYFNQSPGKMRDLQYVGNPAEFVTRDKVTGAVDINDVGRNAMRQFGQDEKRAAEIKEGTLDLRRAQNGAYEERYAGRRFGIVRKHNPEAFNAAQKNYNDQFGLRAEGEADRLARAEEAGAARALELAKSEGALAKDYYGINTQARTELTKTGWEQSGLDRRTTETNATNRAMNTDDNQTILTKTDRDNAARSADVKTEVAGRLAGIKLDNQGRINLELHPGVQANKMALARVQAAAHERGITDTQLAAHANDSLDKMHALADTKDYATLDRELATLFNAAVSNDVVASHTVAFLRNSPEVGPRLDKMFAEFAKKNPRPTK